MEGTQPKQNNKHLVCNSQITLRPITLSDIDDFMVWSTDEKVTKFCTWEPFTSKENAIAYMENAILPHPWYRAICLDGRPVGALMVTGNEGNNRCRAELGYHLGSGFWGRGIVTEAVKIAASSIFKEWTHLERLEAYVEVENGGSMRVLEKVGFQREGVLRKHYMIKAAGSPMPAPGPAAFGPTPSASSPTGSTGSVSPTLAPPEADANPALTPPSTTGAAGGPTSNSGSRPVVNPSAAAKSSHGLSSSLLLVVLGATILKYY